VNIDNKIVLAFEALDQNNINKSINLATEIEKDILSIPETTNYLLYHNLCGLLIDIGSSKGDENIIKRGIDTGERILPHIQNEKHLFSNYYNLANGYLCIWTLRQYDCIDQGTIDDSYFKAKDFYLHAHLLLKSIQQQLSDIQIAQFYVNYANCLDSLHRSVDAISNYENALKYLPNMPEALGNKGITLRHLAPLVRGHTHLFYIEAKKLLEKALEYSPPPHMVRPFKENLLYVDRIIQAHKKMEIEPINRPVPVNNFERFTQKICLENHLYLTPTTMIGDDEFVVLGDPMYLSGILEIQQQPGRPERIITFINQLKQEYIMARYFFIQGLSSSKNIASIYKNVELYSPLDYSLEGPYIQLLKTSLRSSMDLLDKMAVFVHDYFRIKKGKDRYIYFRNIWTESPNPYKLKPEFKESKNIFAFALSDIARELSFGGHLNHLIGLRNALTHRFLVVHDIIHPEQLNTDIKRIKFRDFINDCLTALTISKSSIMYLILLIDTEERKKKKGNYILKKIPLSPTEKINSWSPSFLENKSDNELS